MCPYLIARLVERSKGAPFGRRAAWHSRAWTRPRGDHGVLREDTVNCLEYRYDDDPETGPAEPAGAAAVATPAPALIAQVTLLGQSRAGERIDLRAQTVSAPVELPGPAMESLDAVATPAPGALGPRISLRLEGVRRNAAPAVTYEIYANLPQGVEPEYRNDYFVGVVNLFAIDAHAEHGGGKQDFDITNVVRGLQDCGEWQGQIVVTFVPRGFVPPSAADATRAADVAEQFPGASPEQWVTVERISVSTVE
jgi:hypothetical protein